MIPYNLVKYPVLFLFHWEIYFNFSLNNVHDKSFWWEQHIRETCWLNIAANKSTRRGLHVGRLLTAEFDIPRPFTRRQTQIASPWNMRFLGHSGGDKNHIASTFNLGFSSGVSLSASHGNDWAICLPRITNIEFIISRLTFESFPAKTSHWLFQYFNWNSLAHFYF